MKKFQLLFILLLSAFLVFSCSSKDDGKEELTDDNSTDTPTDETANDDDKTDTAPENNDPETSDPSDDPDTSDPINDSDNTNDPDDPTDPTDDSGNSEPDNDITDPTDDSDTGTDTNDDDPEIIIPGIPVVFGNICTGETKCYDETAEITCPDEGETFFGQDAQYAKKNKCKPQSFQIKTVSNQNVVIDKNTGLIWQQSIPKEKYKWEDAVDYCKNLTYAGYSDWRLPTPQELLTIVDNSKHDPAINTTYFPNTPSSSFFVQSNGPDTSENAWRVHFSYGDVYDDRFVGHYRYVRCVR